MLTLNFSLSVFITEYNDAISETVKAVRSLSKVNSREDIEPLEKLQSHLMETFKEYWMPHFVLHEMRVNKFTGEGGNYERNKALYVEELTCDPATTSARSTVTWPMICPMLVDDTFIQTKEDIIIQHTEELASEVPLGSEEMEIELRQYCSGTAIMPWQGSVSKKTSQLKTSEQPWLSHSLHECSTRTSILMEHSDEKERKDKLTVSSSQTLSTSSSNSVLPRVISSDKELPTGKAPLLLDIHLPPVCKDFSKPPQPAIEQEDLLLVKMEPYFSRLNRCPRRENKLVLQALLADMFAGGPFEQFLHGSAKLLACLHLFQDITRQISFTCLDTLEPRTTSIKVDQILRSKTVRHRLRERHSRLIVNRYLTPSCTEPVDLPTALQGSLIALLPNPEATDALIYTQDLMLKVKN